MARLKSIVFLAACAACLWPGISAPMALAGGIAFALLLGNPFAARVGRISGLLLKICVVGLGFGLPLATVELKNAYTGQTATNALKQYMKDRVPKASTPLIDFNQRALVHFAVDTAECYMTTRLAGDKTFFLPFNQGN